MPESRLGSSEQGISRDSTSSGMEWVLLLGGAACFLPTEASLRGGLGMPLVVLGLIGLAIFLGWRALGATRGAAIQPRWSLVDGLWAGFFLWYSTSVWVGVFGQTLEVRPAIGLFWQQCSMAAVYVWGRHLGVQSEAKRRAVQGLVAVSLSLAAMAWYQYWVVIPDMHAAYQVASEEERVQWLNAAGVWETEVDSGMRQLFESRLFNREPFGPFTLANTLGAVLVPGTVLSLLLAFQAAGRFWRRGQRRAGQELVLWGVAWLIVSSALALTSSRAAILATVLGSAGWLLSRIGTRIADRSTRVVDESAGGGAPSIAGATRRLGVGVAAAVVAVLPLIVVTALWALGRLDSELLSSAPASIETRLQYWLASLDMIQARPWWGWGPGQFQAAYAGFQLAEASETVADPHNAFFELAATAGLPAGTLFLAGVLAVWWVRPRSEERRWPAAASAFAPGSEVGESRGYSLLFPAAVLGGAWLLGSAVAWLGDGVSQPWWCSLLGAGLGAVWWIGLRALTSGGELQLVSPDSVTARGGQGQTHDWDESIRWALGASLLCLMATGGINYPAVAYGFYLLVALALTPSMSGDGGEGDDTAATATRLDRRSIQAGLPVGTLSVVGPWLAAATVAGLAAWAYFLHTVPVIRAEWAVQRSRDQAGWAPPAAVVRELKSALALDPQNADAALDLATWTLIENASKWDRPEVRAVVDAAFQRAADARPLSSPVRARLGELYLKAAAQAAGNPARQRPWLVEASKWYERASQLKPTDSRLLAQRSWLAYALEQPAQARALAAELREASGRRLHVDQQPERLWFNALIVPGLAFPPASSLRDVTATQVIRANVAEWLAWLQDSEEPGSLRSSDSRTGRVEADSG